MSQEFGSTVDDVVENKNPKYRKTEFLNLTAGEHRIRILESMETKKYTHYIGFAYVECLGEECPVCENNKKILYEHPEDYREQRGWSPRSQRFYINILDKTLVRTCPKCHKETQEVFCPDCTNPTSDPAPSNRVKVFSMGKQLLEDVKVLSRSVRNKQDERIDIRTYDFILAVRGAKQSKTISVAHKWYPGDEAFEDVKEDAFFDLENVAIKLSREEMLDLFNGASLKDIFAIRRAKRESINRTETGSEQLREDINAAVDEVFGF